MNESNTLQVPSTTPPTNNMPLSQWLLQDIPTTGQAKLSTLDITQHTPNSSGLPHITPLGPLLTDYCSADELCVRQYCILVARATVNDWVNLANDYRQYILQYSDINYLPVHYKKALESLLCCHIFAGIPRCIEGLYTVRNAEKKYFSLIKQLQSLSKLNSKQSKYLQELIKVKSIIDMNQPVNDRTEYIAVPNNNKKCTCSCSTCTCKPDDHSTSIRQQRGDIILQQVYRNTYNVLKSNLQREHLNLWNYIQENVYGVQLARNILTIQEIECVAVSSLIGMQCERQILSHMRGAKLNGVKYELLLNIIHDLRLVYTPQVIENAINTLNRIYKVKSNNRTSNTDILNELSISDDEDDDDNSALQSQQLNLHDKQNDMTVNKMYTIDPKIGHTRPSQIIMNNNNELSSDGLDDDSKSSLTKLQNMQQMMKQMNERIEQTEQQGNIAASKL